MHLLSSMRSLQVSRRVLNHLKSFNQSPHGHDLPSLNSSDCVRNVFVSSTQRKLFSVSAQNLGNLEENNTEEPLGVPKRDVEVETVKPQSDNENEGSVGKDQARSSLWALFADEKKKKRGRSLKLTDYGREDRVSKELSPDMLKFAKHLYLGGYLKEANFMPNQEFDSAAFEIGFARGFLRFAAVNFARDHREIAKWLSASDLKKVALFGCPSLGLKSIRAAKNMRKFFEINEKEVCAKCKLNNVCLHVNKTFNKSMKELHLDGVTRVLTMYAMEITPQELVVPEEIKKSVSRLLNEIIDLSKTVSRNLPETG